MSMHDGTLPAVWQISGGPTSRPYGDVFLRYGVALIGPGDAGPWRENRNDEEFGGGFVRRFASKVRQGDVLLLRAGNRTIAAVGIVASEYLYLHCFDDVNGWDLQHARRVRWYRLPTPYTFPSLVFGGNPARFARIWNEEVLDYVNRFVNSPPTDWQYASLPDRPPEEPPLEDVPHFLRDLVAMVEDLMPLWEDRRSFGDHPSEDELLAHLVVPLLRALGWPAELIAVQWRRVDVATFYCLPRSPETCRLVIEVKRLGAGVEGALEQAKGYVQTLSLMADVVVTDGVRYRLYDPRRDFAPVAYSHLGRLKASAIKLLNRMRRP